MRILRILVVLVLCSAPTAVTGEKRAMTVDDMLDLVRIGDVVMTPDGSKVFYTERRLDWETNKYSKTLFMVPSKGGDAVVFVGKDGAENFRISPDGRFLSMLREVDDKPQLFLMSLGGGEAWQLTHHEGEISDYKWAGDSRSIVIVSEEAMGEVEKKQFELGKDPIFVNEVHGTNTNLYRLHIATDRLEALSSREGTFRAVDYSRDRRTIAFTFDDFVTPMDLYSSSIDGSDSVRLTRANGWVEDEILLPKSQVIQWRSHDGVAIEGIFMLPAGHREGTKLPLILQIHGGPDGYWANTFEPDLIIYTGLGYAVLGPNVRGSSGYGDELLRGLMGDMGGGEYHDLMTGVDHVIDAGYIDKDKMGVAGWSWGGVLGGWVITQTDRFKAASVGAGVSNWVGESGPGFNWDISNWHIGGKHWTNREEWRRRSAINFVERVSTPTLFLHGAEDQTSSTNQSMVYFDALQERGIPTRFIKFPRQKHGIREPRLLRVRIVEDLRWMQKYVLGLEWTPWVRPVEDDAPARIALHSDRDGNSEIYTIAPTGAGETRLTFTDDCENSGAAFFRPPIGE